MDTACKKCRAPMSHAACTDTFLGRGVTTGYSCACGHWNDLKRRKGFAEWKTALRQRRQEHGNA